MKQQKHYTRPVSELKRKDCETLIKLALEEDAPNGDPTSESIFHETDRGKARIIAKESGILCGMPVVEIVLEIFMELTGKTVALRPVFRDSLMFQSGDVLCEIEGHLTSLLRLERIILNFMQYLSGISTVTARAVEAVPDDIIILDTRKTLPGYRKLAKYAVFCGGGSNHRINLSDMALIKDNHLAASTSIGNAITSVRMNNPNIPIEVEVDTLEQLETTLLNSADVIMLDNMDRATLEKAFRIIHNYKNPPFIEVSGGFTPEKISELRGFGRIGVSMGYLTHTTRFLDLSMEFVKKI